MGEHLHVHMHLVDVGAHRAQGPLGLSELLSGQPPPTTSRGQARSGLHKQQGRRVHVKAAAPGVERSLRAGLRDEELNERRGLEVEGAHRRCSMTMSLSGPAFSSGWGSYLGPGRAGRTLPCAISSARRSTLRLTAFFSARTPTSWGAGVAVIPNLRAVPGRVDGSRPEATITSHLLPHGVPGVGAEMLFRPSWPMAAATDENRACPAKLGFPWCERARYSD